MSAIEKNYLDFAGLTAYDAKIKDWVGTVGVSPISTDDINALFATTPVVTIKSFAEATDEELAAMLTAYYNDDITWSDMGWAIGDTRVIHFNSMQAPTPNSSKTWDAQDITIVIVAHDHTDLTTPINGHTKACITVQTREVMNNNTGAYNQDTYIYVNGDSSKDTTFTPWSNLYMRTYLNNIVLGSIPSGDFKSSIKQSKHNRLTSNGINPTNTPYTKDGSHTDRTTEIVNDMMFLPSYTELYGNVRYDYYLGGGTPNNEEGTQFPYYTSDSNRSKHSNNNGVPTSGEQWWWIGSPASDYYDGYHWGGVNLDGTASYFGGNYSFALAPAWAM